jgi:hypothetical protein
MNASFTFVASFVDILKREILSLLQDFVHHSHELLFGLSKNHIIIHLYFIHPLLKQIVR